MLSQELADLEAKGAAQVLREIAAGAHGAVGSPLRDSVEAWLRAKEVEAAALAASNRDSREERTLSIASDASRWARWAAIIAIAASVYTARESILAIIFGS